jgi:hypothetical protein
VLSDGAGYVKLHNGQPNLTAEAKSPLQQMSLLAKKAQF